MLQGLPAMTKEKCQWLMKQPFLVTGDSCKVHLHTYIHLHLFLKFTITFTIITIYKSLLIDKKQHSDFYANKTIHQSDYSGVSDADQTIRQIVYST
jgi:hypothetical protein